MPYRDKHGQLYDDDGDLMERVDFESQDDGDDDEPEPPKATSRKRNWRDDLEDRARRGSKAAQEAADLKRENAFLKAGINPEDPKARYFVKGYDGDLTSEAIKSAAGEIGLTQAPAAETAPSEEQAAHERMAEANAGTSPAGQRDFNAEMRAAQTQEEFHKIAREAGVRFADGAYSPPANQ